MLIEIAGMVVEIHARYPYTYEQCTRYAAPAGSVSDFSVSVDDAALAQEQAGFPEAPAHLLENTAIYRAICAEAIRRDILLMHGSALSMDGRGYLFCAPSGTGKSTHAAIWRRVFGDRVTMVNDDKPLLRITDAGTFVCGTPWDGKHHLSTPGESPLNAICFLERGETNEIREVTYREIYPRMLGQTYRPSDPAAMMATLQLLDKLAHNMKFYILKCNISPEAAEVACRGMGGRK